MINVDETVSMKCSKQLDDVTNSVSLAVVGVCTFSISRSSLLTTTSMTLTDNVTMFVENDD